VDVDVVPVKTEDLQRAAIARDERGEDLAANSLDLLLYPIVHVRVRLIGWPLLAVAI
jgi:hypothetical protein